MELMVILWLVMSAFCGWIASQKGRSFLGWLLLGLVLSPLIAIIGLVAVPSRHQPAAPEYDPHHRRHQPQRGAGVSIADLPPRNDRGFPDLPPRRDA